MEYELTAAAIDPLVAQKVNRRAFALFTAHNLATGNFSASYDDDGDIWFFKALRAMQAAGELNGENIREISDS